MSNFKLNKVLLVQAVLTLIIAVLGMLFIRYIWIETANKHSNNALQIARSIGTTLPVDDIKKLEAKPSDIEMPQYHMIKNKLKKIIRINHNARFAYIYTEQNGKIFFNVDSEPEGSKDYSHPGQEYTEATPQDKQPFRDGKELVTGPLTDRWGTWISVSVPIKDTVTGKVIAVFGMDFDANHWNYLLFYEVFQPSLVVVLLLIVLFISIRIISKNNSLKNEITERKQAEEALRESEKRSRRQREAIVSLAFEKNIITGDVHNALQKLTDVLSAAVLVNRVSVWSVSKDGLEMKCLCLYEAKENRYSSGVILKVADYPVYFHTIFTESLVSAGEAQSDPRTEEFKDNYLKPLGITSMLDAGIWIDGKPIGVVCFEHIGEKRDWYSDEKAFANTAAAIVMQIFSNNERKQAEEALQKSEAGLRKLNSEKDKFFSIIAHDLRSPFNGFLGLTELMVNNMENSSIEEFQEMGGLLHTSAANLFSLLTNLLEWSKMQRGLTAFNPRKLQLKRLTEEVIFIFDETAKKKGIEIEEEISEDVFVMADKLMLETIIRNLISNAFKFTKKGGRVTISANESAGKVEISIKDTGIGMDKELLNNLFKIDKQTSRTGTDNEQSTGLGLLLCKEFIEKHNGRIMAESDEGKGSRFSFTLPSEKVESKNLNKV